MINATELRIGSLVKYKYHTDPFSTIKCIDGDHVLLNNEHADDYVIHDDIEPITLTEEILMKCGFNDRFHDGSYLYLFNKDIVQLNIKFYGETPWLKFRNQDLVPVRELHKLQNLHFDLTGTNLKYQI